MLDGLAELDEPPLFDADWLPLLLSLGGPVGCASRVDVNTMVLRIVDCSRFPSMTILEDTEVTRTSSLSLVL